MTTAGNLFTRGAHANTLRVSFTKQYTLVHCRDGSIYRNFCAISVIPTLSVSCLIGVFIIVFSKYRIVSVTSEISRSFSISLYTYSECRSCTFVRCFLDYRHWNSNGKIIRKINVLMCWS